jgi:hypothetical protein
VSTAALYGANFQFKTAGQASRARPDVHLHPLHLWTGLYRRSAL